MKTPRVEDFYPDAKPVPSLSSPMDNLPTIQKPLPPKKDGVLKQEASEGIQPVPPYPVRDVVPRTSTVSHPVPRTRRKIKQRHPFDIYEDQYETLKQISDAEKDQGLPGSMSAMVRKGIDMYLEARKQGKI